ncbi:MAG: hemerythrin domain-containing protein [Acidobacteriota bacterium]
MKKQDRGLRPEEQLRIVSRGARLRQRRRETVLRLFAIAGVAGVSFLTGRSQQVKAEEAEEEVSAAEDLMREHGVLNRILLIYDESIFRLEQNRELNPAVLSGAAGIIRAFIEDYHEKLEEDYLFPRYQKAGRLTDLVAVLKRQHRAGRRLTDSAMRLAKASVLNSPEEKAELVRDLKAFVRMYRPHEAREDTVLFPALKKIVSRNEYDSLGEEFEKKEHALFGEDGFGTMVDKVAGLEKQLGIYELAQFTPSSK